MADRVKRKRILVAYIPVIHRGYLQLFDTFSGSDALYVLGPDLLAEEDYLRKELRAISPVQAAELVKSLKIFPEVLVLDKVGAGRLNDINVHVTLPDEDVSHRIAEKYLTKAEIEFYPIFLRWDRRNIEINQSTDDISISDNPRDANMMELAYAEALRSADIWRRVGAVIARNNVPLLQAENRQLATQNTAWAEGDPRALFNRGTDIEMSTFMHAEASLIARAAREGLSLKGATFYVTVFPCPICAMLIAQSGITTCCFAGGYAMLDGRRVLEEAGIQLLRVPASGTEDDNTLMPYPGKSKS